MEEKKKANEKMQTKSKSRKVTIIILILAIIVTAILNYFAYSKYTSMITGNGTATVAKWSFKVNGQTEQFATINLAETRNEAYNVADGVIAPGTSGQFDLVLDATGSEVGIDYTITMNLSDKPQNLMFYTDSNYTKPVTTSGTTATINGYINLNEVSTPQTKTIYWNWPYQTGTTENEKSENNEQDTLDSGKTCTIPITVTAVQKNPNEEPGTKLADVVSVGDYVNYNAASGNGAGKTYTTEESLTGSSTTATFNSSDTMKWKVMSVDKATGTVELMAEDPTVNRVTLYGKTGYKNAETVLNKVGAVYGYGDGATGGRSITIEDVNKLENYTPTDDLATSYTYTRGTFINEDGTEVTATEDNPVTKSYTASTAEKSTNKYYSYTTTNFSGKTFWLGSRCFYLYSSICDFNVRNVYSGDVYDDRLFSSYGGEYDNDRAALPVVSLKSNIQTSGKDESGAWNLVIE